MSWTNTIAGLVLLAVFLLCWWSLRWIDKWLDVLDAKYGEDWPEGRSMRSLVREEKRARKRGWVSVHDGPGRPDPE